MTCKLTEPYFQNYFHTYKLPENGILWWWEGKCSDYFIWRKCSDMGKMQWKKGSHYGAAKNGHLFGSLDSTWTKSNTSTSLFQDWIVSQPRFQVKPHYDIAEARCHFRTCSGARHQFRIQTHLQMLPTWHRLLILPPLEVCLDYHSVASSLALSLSFHQVQNWRACGRCPLMRQCPHGLPSTWGRTGKDTWGMRLFHARIKPTMHATTYMVPAAACHERLPMPATDQMPQHCSLPWLLYSASLPLDCNFLEGRVVSFMFFTRCSVVCTLPDT